MLAQAVRSRFLKDAAGDENELILTDVADLDITDVVAVSEKIAEIKPELIINCAAYTNVDGAETQQELAEKINADGPGNLAKAAAATGAILVHISTDYVFGGKKPVTEGYVEDDEKQPETAYGITKLHGEEQIEENCTKYYIFRTAWLYGEGPNFVRTMLSLGKNRSEISVVNDQWGSPTYTEDLANMIYEIVDKKTPYGVYHATDEGFTTWADFTKEIFRQAGVGCKVNGVSSEKYEKIAGKTVAPRPKNSKMSKQKLIDAGVKIRSWKEALNDYLKKEAK